jgi:AraC-like DNA-binding protein
VTHDPGIGWIPSASATLTRLRNLVPRGTVVVPCADDDALVSAIVSGRVGVTVVEAGGSTHALTMMAVRRVREAFPEHPLIAWCDFRTIQPPYLLDIARAGVSDIIRQDDDELPFAFARLLSAARQRRVSARIAAMLGDIVPVRLRPVFEYALENAGAHLDRDAVAAVFGVSRRTLHNRLAEAGLPTTRAFLTWCRVLVASALLEQPGYTLDSVAGQLDFTDGGNLGQMFRRYTGCNITQARELGVLATTADALRAHVQRALAHAAPHGTVTSTTSAS